MELKRFSISGLLYLLLVSPVSVQSAACTVSGATLLDATRLYASQCGLPMKDCDPLDNRWYCSSENVHANSVSAISQSDEQASTVATADASDRQVEFLSSSLQRCVDHDGDGWGWDGSSSCKVGAQSGVVKTAVANIESDSSQVSSDSCVDSDGDGWGWNGSASCRVSEVSASAGSSNQINQANQSNPTSQFEQKTETNAHCKGSYNPADITDLVLVTGQSNVTGAQTSVSATTDQWGKVIEFHAPDNSHPRVFVWTVDPASHNAGTGWRVAALNQTWHDSAPGVGGIARNNFGFHFAKQVAERGGCRVVGFVMVSEGGKGISHWDYNAPGWNEVVSQVTEAMSAIGRSSIDGILWHQGESDWIIDGTCYTGDRCRNNQPDYYPQKLYSQIANKSIPNAVGKAALIDRLRAESWFSAGKPFIAGETIQAPVNAHLNKLNTDNDHWTACVNSDMNSGLGIRADDPFRNHYNAAGLRELGARYATEYLKMTGH